MPVNPAIGRFVRRTGCNSCKLPAEEVFNSGVFSPYVPVGVSRAR